MKFAASPLVLLDSSLGTEKEWATSFFEQKNSSFCHTWEEANLVIINDGTAWKDYPNAFVISGEMLPDERDNRAFYFMGQVNDETQYHSQLRQAYNCFLNWQELRQNKEHFIVPKSYLKLFSDKVHNQLKGMSGLANILKENYLSDIQREKYANVISGNANGLQNFFSNLWEYYQYTHNERDLKLQSFCLTDFMEELQERFERILVSQEKSFIQLELGLLPADKQKKITTDKRRLIIILSNILDNAINYTATGLINWNLEILENSFLITIVNKSTPTSKKKFKLENKPGFNFGLGLLVAHHNTEIISGELTMQPSENETSAILLIPFSIT